MEQPWYDLKICKMCSLSLPNWCCIENRLVSLINTPMPLATYRSESGSLKHAI